MDFGLLPPEINSGRMYTGPGSGPMLAAAAGWDGLAAELHNMAAAYESAVGELAARWLGSSATTMATAASPYTTWLHTTAAQAEQAAAQARMAAAAYEAAFAATVPPPMIAANRSLLMTLVATNFLGQNTPAIAATEAHYAEMWAQDATAMYLYADSSALAARLNVFTQPSETANPATPAGQSAAVGRATGTSAGSNLQNQLARLVSTVPRMLRHLTRTSARTAASAGPGIESGASGITDAMAQVMGPYSPLGYLNVAGGWWLTFGQVLGMAQNIPGVTNLLGAPKPITGALAPLSGHLIPAGSLSPGPVAGQISAALSRAGLVGGLSVPTSWVSAAPAIKAVATAIPTPGLAAPAVAAQGPAGLFGGTAALSGLAGRAMDAAAARSAGAVPTRTIGTAAACVGAAAADDVDPTVTILVIPPSDK